MTYDDGEITVWDCEIEGCVNKTDGFLCETHQDKALVQANIIVVCEQCNKITKIKEPKEGDDMQGKRPRYEFVTDCMRCRPQTD